MSTRNGEPLAFINDGVLQHMRVGGGAGIGARHLARADARTVGILGSGGRQAHSAEQQVERLPCDAVGRTQRRSRQHDGERLPRDGRR